MRILADENVPRAVVEAIRDAGHDIAWMADVTPGLTDRDVLAMAAGDRRLLLTLDKDFGELAFSVGLPSESGVLLVRVHDLPPQQLALLVVDVLAGRDDWEDKFAVLTTRRLRIREMPKPASP